jgi:hypothetical protein
LEPLASLPDVPTAWADELPDLMTRQTKSATQSQALADAIAELQALLDGLIVDEVACNLKGRIELLADLRARYVTAEKDLPDRRVRLGLAEQAVARTLSRIDRSFEEKPERFNLATSVTGPLRDLIERRSGVEAAVAVAESEVDKARASLSQAVAAIGDVDGECDEAAISQSLRTIGSGFDETVGVAGTKVWRRSKKPRRNSTRWTGDRWKPNWLSKTRGSTTRTPEVVFSSPRETRPRTGSARSVETPRSLPSMKGGPRYCSPSKTGRSPICASGSAPPRPTGLFAPIAIATVVR